ncbi:MAG TPA: CHASE3 domain-containing protein [Candidatus Baltobacteraceae bacterium]|jgi:CHASE3 domain sensor protein|nr:CHASE3 domain-containing protein [Candidatus Baltobacteraceae bacterium]
MKDNIEKRVICFFILMSAILVYVAATAVRNIQRSIKSEAWVNKTHDVIIHAAEIVSYLHAGDAALRTFMITGESRDQIKYRNAYSTMIERQDELLALTRSGAEDAELHEKVLGLDTLVSNRVEIARSVAKAREQGGLEDVRKLYLSNPDAESIGRIERYVTSLIGTERELLSRRDVDEYTQAVTTKWTVYSGVAVNFVLLAFVFGLLRDDLHARRVAAKALEEANAQLEVKVQERTADLIKANHALKQENLERRWSYQTLDHQGRYNQLIINSISEMVFVISRALNVSRINPAVVHQTHWQPQDLIAQSIERVVKLTPDSGNAPEHNPLSQAMRDGREIQERPAVLTTRSGRTIPVRFSLVPLHDQDKVVGGVLTVRIPEGVQRPN